LNRREFLRLSALAPAALLAWRTAAASGSLPGGRRVIVLGIDGMDPGMVKSLIEAGRMPNAARLAAMGGLSDLATSNPPQSPVAWSSFISGFGPEVHGIYDFIHREPGTVTPYLSTSRVTAAARTLDIGRWRLPLSGARVEQLRMGTPFWKSLTNDGIPVTLVKLPVEFPPDRGSARIISGLGTPDMRGSQGSFTYFTDDPRAMSSGRSGGIVVPVRDYGDGLYEASIEGPENSMIEGNPPMTVPLKVWVDRVSGSARIDLPDTSIVLGAGEWSGWKRMRFDAIRGISSVSAIARFYLKSVDPRLRLYMSPLNIDPENPALPISEPDGWSRTLSEKVGPFYTQGFPEDTKALSRGVLDDEEYLQQAMIVLGERRRLYEETLGDWDDGLYFCYFGSLDLNMHMFYRTLDPLSPLHSTTDLARFGCVMPDLYSQIDEVIGQAMDMLDGRTALIVMSDHGFAPFRRAFNLNSWLVAEGYASLLGSGGYGDRDGFADTDWSATAAYGLGLNSLFLNMAGREPGGVVDPGERTDLLGRLARDLESAVDPATGERVVDTAYVVEGHGSGDVPAHAPDIIVGYARGTRASWETTLGSYPRDVLLDNEDPWSGTHCIAPGCVPGTLISSVPVTGPDPDLRDLGRSIASIMGASVLPAGGRVVLG
jgi:predicted AlkP superfamily phosphohydrolase/phosphomutase